MCCPRNSEADQAILRALQGDDHAIAAAIDQIHANYCIEIANAIRRCYPGLRPDELADAWQETLLDIVIKARAKKVDQDGSLRGWLRKIALRRGVDILRQKSRWKDVWHQIEDVLTTIAERVEQDPLAFRELLAAIRDEIRRLPGLPRIAWEVYAEFGFEASHAELAAKVSAGLGRVVDEQRLGHALQAGRTKLRLRLKTWFRDWFGEWFDNWVDQRFEDWFDRRFKLPPRTEHQAGRHEEDEFDERQPADDGS